jgi:hypothetical protein
LLFSPVATHGHVLLVIKKKVTRTGGSVVPIKGNKTGGGGGLDFDVD